jgi:carboxyl-terminal processing protease
MPKRNIAWMLVVALFALLFWQLPPTIARRDSVYRTLSPLVEIRSLIRKRYVEEVDDDQLVRGAIEGMLHNLDPFSAYFSEEEYGDFQRHAAGSYDGVGIELGVAPGGELIIISPIEGGPAFSAGVLPGDQILEIDGEPAENLTPYEASKQILGNAGTTVTLKVRHTENGGGVESFTLTRATITLHSVNGWSRNTEGAWNYWIDPNRRLAYVRVSHFIPETVGSLDKVVEESLTDGMQGFILDLRGNPGGLLESAVEMADRFLDDGIIVTTRGRWSQADQVVARSEGTYPQFPMVVLVDRFSASGAEIVAGALRDHGRATVIGERTFGKGTVQNVIELEDHSSALRLTTAYYYLPNGECIHRTQQAEKEGKWGVEPDIAIPLTLDELTEIYRSRAAVDRTALPSEQTDQGAEPVVRAPLIDKHIQRGLQVLTEQLPAGQQETEHDAPAEP